MADEPLGRDDMEGVPVKDLYREEVSIETKPLHGNFAHDVSRCGCDCCASIRNSLQMGEELSSSPFARQEGGDHYKDMTIQPAEFISKNGIGFLEGCVIKRMCRWRAKDGIKDLRKAIHEIELLIEMEGK